MNFLTKTKIIAATAALNAIALFGLHPAHPCSNEKLKETIPTADIELLKECLAANPTTAKKLYASTLIQAARSNDGPGSRELAEKIIKSGFSPNNPYHDDNWETDDNEWPIIIAAWSRRSDLISLFLENGANANVKDRHGQTALINAVYSHVLFQEDPFKSNYYVIDELLATARDNARYSRLPAKLSVNASDEDGDTALIIAARYGNARLVGSLVLADADVHAKNKQGLTALEAARQHKEKKLKDIKKEFEDCEEILQKNARKQ